MKNLTPMCPQSMKFIFAACSLAISLAVTGCSKKEEVRGPAPAPQTAMPKLSTDAADSSAPPPTAGAPVPATVNTAAQPADQGELTDDSVKDAMASLNAAVGGFKAELGRAPSSLQELMRRGFWMARLPASPEGKKYWLDPQKNQVVLADRKPGELDPEPPTPEEARQAAIQSAIEFSKRQRQARTAK